jgi:hypothetical protein
MWVRIARRAVISNRRRTCDDERWAITREMTGQPT